ncbi:MAG: hypothetical protein CO072_01380 [Candidatus Huberarchaeum crystalense]|uniref:Transposase n=1 Tax=Huberarchaeum crystalense TaxID=2014257 RepID=A0A2H9RD15_HUBC1|nr:MAG: hypothetical protein CO072_01380 [Candidatus Huberarchaeum crystalense]
MSNQNKQLNSSAKKRKGYSPQFKFDRAIEIIKSNTISEVSRKYGVNVNVLSHWKTQLLERGSHIFEMAPDQENKELKSKITRLEQMVGKKEIELNLIKNFSDFYQSQNTS